MINLKLHKLSGIDLCRPDLWSLLEKVIELKYIGTPDRHKKPLAPLALLVQQSFTQKQCSLVVLNFHPALLYEGG
jgi:hypothetical protein